MKPNSGFIGRTNERRALVNALNRDGSRVIMVEGPWRNGKTTFVLETLRDMDFEYIFFQAREITAKCNLLSLGEIIGEHVGLSLGFNDYEALFSYLCSISTTKPLVMIIDDYPYLKSTNNDMDAIIYNALKTYGVHSKLKLILIAEDGLIIPNRWNSKESHHDLRWDVIHIQPLDYFDSASFYPTYRSKDKLALYSVFGGVPYCNALIDHSLSVDENIIQLVVDPNGQLHDMVERYLYRHFKKIDLMNAVLEVIAHGHSKFMDILHVSHIGTSVRLAQVLNKLIAAGLVKRVEPLNMPKNKKRAQYHISDPFTHFYYRYIFPDPSTLITSSPLDYFNKQIKVDFYDHYVPLYLGIITYQFLIHGNQHQLIQPTFDQIGCYAYADPITKTNGLLDLVTCDKDGYVIYACLSNDHPLSFNAIYKEIQQATRSGLLDVRYRLITTNGVKGPLPYGCTSYTLDQLYDPSFR